MFEVCRRCLMPNTRPRSPFEDGRCQACWNFDTRKDIDWDVRLQELSEVCGQHYRTGEWDCLIPVSGGKDSHTLVYYIKEVMGMNPLLVTVGDPFTRTIAGTRNYYNLGEAFGCDQILFTVNSELFKYVTRTCFEKYLDPLRFLEQALMIFPLQVAVKFGINLVIEAESDFIYGGSNIERKDVTEITKKELGAYDISFWEGLDVDREELNAIIPPTPEEMENLKIYWMSYFVPWSSIANRDIAKQYGFTDLTHEWKREGCIEDFEQIDSFAYLTHIWLKYPKFGFQRVSDIVSRRLREGRLSISEAKQLILERDHILDQRALDDFCKTLGYSIREFWDVVHHFWNTDLFGYDKYGWKMKVDRFGGV